MYLTSIGQYGASAIDSMKASLFDIGDGSSEKPRIHWQLSYQSRSGGASNPFTNVHIVDRPDSVIDCDASVDQV